MPHDPLAPRSAPGNPPAASGTLVIPVPRLHEALWEPAGATRAPQNMWSPCLADSPLTKAEVRATLASLRAMTADEMGQALNMAAAEYLREPFSRSESAALAALERESAALATQDDMKTPGTDSRIDPRLLQQQLLMVWVQEERVLDILELTRRSAASERRLQSLLGDEDFAELLQESAAAELDAGADSENIDRYSPEKAMSEEASSERTIWEIESVRGLLPSWKFVFSRLARLMPENSALTVNDPDMVEAVLACGTPEDATKTLGTGCQAVRVLASSLVPGLPETAFVCLLQDDYK